MHNMTWLYIFVMIAVTYLIRTVPLTVFTGKVENRFIRSFLYYVPYVTLTLMTFPAILKITDNPAVGGLALLAGLAAAMKGRGLFQVALICSMVVLILTLIGM